MAKKKSGERSRPKAETLVLVGRARALVEGGALVRDAVAQVGISHTSYKDTRNWMKKNQTQAE